MIRIRAPPPPLQWPYQWAELQLETAPGPLRTAGGDSRRGWGLHSCCHVFHWPRHVSRMTTLMWTLLTCSLTSASFTRTVTRINSAPRHQISNVSTPALFQEKICFKNNFKLICYYFQFVESTPCARLLCTGQCAPVRMVTRVILMIGVQRWAAVKIIIADLSRDFVKLEYQHQIIVMPWFQMPSRVGMRFRKK